MRRARRGGAAAALCATLAGCVSQTQLTKVETAAASFHARQRGGDDAANYAGANDAFHGRVSASAFATSQAAVRALTECSAPLRDVDYAKPGAWSGGTYVQVRYTRTCREGGLTEWMSFNVTIDGPARLDDYVAYGPALPGSSPPS